MEEQVHQMTNEKIEAILNEPAPEQVPEEDPNPEQKEPETETPEVQEEEAKPDYETLAKQQQERIEKQEKLLAKLGTEIGLLRKTSPEEEKERLQKIRDMYLDDPIAAQEELDRYKEEKREQERIQLESHIERNKTAIESLVPDFSATVPEMVEVLTEDGYEREAVEIFQKNPYQTPSDLLYMLHKRVVEKKENQGLKGRITELEGQIAALKKKPDAILERVEQAARRPLTGKTGGAAPKETAIPNAPPHRLSREELEKLANGG